MHELQRAARQRAAIPSLVATLWMVAERDTVGFSSPRAPILLALACALQSHIGITTKFGNFAQRMQAEY
jgi:hypothetical protein